MQPECMPCGESNERPALNTMRHGIAALSRRPFQRAASEQMYMQMKHRLPSFRSHVKNRAVPVLDGALARYFGCCQMAASHQFFISDGGLLQAGNVFLGNYQNVGRSLWADVFEGIDVRVLVDLLGGHIATKNTAKQAI